MTGAAQAEGAPAQSPWHLYDLIDSGVAVTTADGTLEFCNLALLQLLARSTPAPVRR